MQFMASYNGATGSICSTPQEAAASFFQSYPKARKANVRGGRGSDGVFVTTFGNPSWSGLSRAVALDPRTYLGAEG